MDKVIDMRTPISILCSELTATANMIDMLSDDISSVMYKGNDELLRELINMRFDELEHIQRFVLKLTEEIAGQMGEGKNYNEDETVFGEGELNFEKGKDSDAPEEK